MNKKLNKFIRVTHRDLGYIFFAMCIIYGLSGIAINHRDSWNPSYMVTEEEYPLTLDSNNISESTIKAFLSEIDQEGTYKKHIKRDAGQVKVFIKQGTVVLDFAKKTANLETIHKRPLFNQFNFLHYNSPRHLWTWFSDAFAISLIIIAITGLFMVKGKNGITRRGGILTAIGIIIPIILFFMYS